jgi:hypothetical protein
VLRTGSETRHRKGDTLPEPLELPELSPTVAEFFEQLD